MPYGITPPPQQLRQIGFNLSGGPGPGGMWALNIRPEDMSRTEPSRLTVHQTLGGAWADAFGRGVSTVTLSGTTGWHGGHPAFAQLSGEDAFQQLRAGAFVGWHAAREAVLMGGGDPSIVTLDFIDNLNRMVLLVAPKTFTLKRNKSSPLLMRYHIELLVLDDYGDPGGGGGADLFAAALGDPLAFQAGALALEAAANALEGLGVAL